MGVLLFIIPIVSGCAIGATILHIKLSLNNNKYLGLIMPLIALLNIIYYIVGTLYFYGIKFFVNDLFTNDDIIPSFLLTFVIILYLIIIYFICRKKVKKQKSISAKDVYKADVVDNDLWYSGS